MADMIPDNDKRPHSIEAERAVLGSILLSENGIEGDRIWDVCQRAGVMPDWFFDPKNREIYAAMHDLARGGGKLDHVTVTDALRKKKKLKAVGGAAYIGALYDNTPTTSHAEYYIDIIKQKHLRRMVIERAAKAIEQAMDEEDHSDTVSVIGAAQKDFLEIDASGDPQETWAMMTDRAFDNIKGLMNGTRSREGLDTGLKEVDEVLLGLKPGEMIVIGARPSVGKTALAMNIAEHLAIDQKGEKVPVLIFSLEMSVEALINRMAIQRAKLDRTMLLTGRYRAKTPSNKEAKARFAEAQEVIRNAPLFVDDRSELDISQIRSIARRKVKDNGVKLVIIDYLTLCHYRNVAVSQSRYQEVSLISGQIKAMAKELQVPVIVLSQLSRKASDRGKQYAGPGQDNKEDLDGEEPAKMSDLRESGSIEQDADVVMLLRRGSKKDQHPGQPDTAVVEFINIAKNRNGATKEVEVLFDRPSTHFFDRVKPSNAEK